MPIIAVRCKAKTENTFRQIKVDTEAGTATCSCNGHGSMLFCAHIDAVLIAGERFMVPTEDHTNVEAAMKAVAGQIRVPDEWKAAWRYNMAWRGLSKPRKYVDHTIAHGDDYDKRPSICFTGKGLMPRKALMDHARDRGWKAVDDLVVGLQVLVAEDPTRQTNKLQGARKNGIPVISYDEYFRLNADGEIAGAAT